MMNTTDTSSLANPSLVMHDKFYQSLIVDPSINLSCSHRAMLHDEKDYPDMERFNPERFFKDGLPDLTVRDPATIMFDFGRR